LELKINKGMKTKLFAGISLCLMTFVTGCSNEEIIEKSSIEGNFTLEQFYVSAIQSFVCLRK